jgi:hypothetical protein
MFRILGFVFILGAVGSVVGEVMGLKLPTVSWGFELSRNVEFFRFQTEGGSSLSGFMYSLAQWLNERIGLSDANGLLWFGWLTAAMALGFGVYLLKPFGGRNRSPRSPSAGLSVSSRSGGDTIPSWL